MPANQSLAADLPTISSLTRFKFDNRANGVSFHVATTVTVVETDDDRTSMDELLGRPFAVLDSYTSVFAHGRVTNIDGRTYTTRTSGGRVSTFTAVGVVAGDVVLQRTGVLG